jgi:hypothetical protein
MVELFERWVMAKLISLISGQTVHSVIHQSSRKIEKFTGRLLSTAVSEESSECQLTVLLILDIKAKTLSDTCVLVFPALNDFSSQQVQTFCFAGTIRSS